MPLRRSSTTSYLPLDTNKNNVSRLNSARKDDYGVEPRFAKESLVDGACMGSLVGFLVGPSAAGVPCHDLVTGFKAFRKTCLLPARTTISYPKARRSHDTDTARLHTLLGDWGKETAPRTQQTLQASWHCCPSCPLASTRRWPTPKIPLR
jgi:hypothetical protein